MVSLELWFLRKADHTGTAKAPPPWEAQPTTRHRESPSVCALKCGRVVSAAVGGALQSCGGSDRLSCQTAGARGQGLVICAAGETVPKTPRPTQNLCVTSHGKRPLRREMALEAPGGPQVTAGP